MYTYDEQSMTATEFIEYVRGGWDYWEENIGEHETQYHSECAMFGDAGPGQGYRLNQMKQEMASVARQYERLTGHHPRRDAYPIGCED